MDVLRRLDLKVIAPPDNVSEAVDEKTRQEESDLEREAKKIANRGLAQDQEERKIYGTRIFRMMCLWLLGVFLLLIFQGFGKFYDFRLADSVMLAAIGTTTANVIGVFYVVTKYLFPNK